MFKKSVFSGIRMTVRRSFTAGTPGNKDILIDSPAGKNSGIFTIYFNRPSVRNAVSRNVIDELSKAFDMLANGREVRVIILSSTSPGIFCAGADLKERITLSDKEVYRMGCKFRALTNQIESTPVPVIAAVDGFALGGGFEIALACDIRVAASNATFGLVETTLGIIPGAGGTQRLPRIVGPSIAKELIFTGRKIDAQTAKEYGIVNHLIEQDNSNNAAYRKAVSIAEEILPNGPVGIQMAKAAINKGLEVDINTGCTIEEYCYARTIPTKDRLEGLQAFREKRPPKYIGE